MDNNSNITQITNTIYLGSIYGLFEYDILKAIKITHILTCCKNAFPVSDEYIQLIIEIDDNSNQNIFKYLKSALDFIEKSTVVFVHCMGGVSRSSSFVIAYLMWKERLSYDKAREYTKSKRKNIYPNPGFEIQLQLFEKELKENDYCLDKIRFDIKIDKVE